jgi:Ni/Fe-hydrogenase subunit HybB-like protein
MHRLDVSAPGLGRVSGTPLAPTWMEVLVSVGLVAIGFAALAPTVRFLRVFPAPGHAPVLPSALTRQPDPRAPGGEP